MFTLTRKNSCYYLHYKPTSFVIVSPTLNSALRHLMLIQSILAGKSEAAARQMRQFNMSGKTLIAITAGLYRVQENAK